MALIKHGGIAPAPAADKTNPDLPIELYPPPRFYLAAPFFNPVQVAMMETIETLMCDNGVPFFSPRLTEHNKKKELTDDDAREIFGQNVQQILECQAMLAVLDWAMPEDQSLRICDTDFKSAGVTWTPRTFSLNLPDAGTVWEMGFAFHKRPIYGFTMRQPGEKVNIMLTQCLEGVIYGMGGLLKFLNKGRVRPGIAVKGQWNHR